MKMTARKPKTLGSGMPGSIATMRAVSKRLTVSSVEAKPAGVQPSNIGTQIRREMWIFWPSMRRSDHQRGRH